MKIKSLRLISVILAALMVLSVLSVVSASADSTASGQTGDCWWRYDEDTKILSISGEGATEDYMIGGAPWFTYDVETVYVEEDVTKLGENFCFGIPSITRVSLPESLEVIGKYAFKGTSIREIVIPYFVTDIGEGAFQSCEQLHTAELGSHLETISYLAFAETNIKSIYIPRNVSTIIWKAFGNYRSDLTLYYAEGTTAAQTVVDFCSQYYFDCMPVSFNSPVLKAGQTKTLYPTASYAGGFTSTKKTVIGTVTALKKGTTKIRAILDDGAVITDTITVKTNPSIKVNNKAFKAKTRYTVKKGKYLTVKITGKAKSVKNIYSTSNKKIAKVTSKNTATTVKIKGVKKGKATVTVKVNGCAFKIKVKVK